MGWGRRRRRRRRRGKRKRDFERLRFSLLLPREYIYENDTSTKPLSFSNSALLFSIVNTRKNSINFVASYTQKQKKFFFFLNKKFLCFSSEDDGLNYRGERKRKCCIIPFPPLSSHIFTNFVRI